MPLPSLVKLPAFEARLGRAVTAAEAGRARADLDDASALVRAEVNRTWVDANGVLLPIPDAVQWVVVAVALRRFLNPEGYSSETSGPFGVRRAGGDEHAGLFLTEAERRALVRAVRPRAAGFVSVPLRPAHVPLNNTTTLPLA